MLCLGWPLSQATRRMNCVVFRVAAESTKRRMNCVVFRVAAESSNKENELCCV